MEFETRRMVTITGDGGDVIIFYLHRISINTSDVDRVNSFRQRRKLPPIDDVDVRTRVEVAVACETKWVNSVEDALRRPPEESGRRRSMFRGVFRRTRDVPSFAQAFDIKDTALPDSPVSFLELARTKGEKIEIAAGYRR